MTIYMAELGWAVPYRVMPCRAVPDHPVGRLGRNDIIWLGLAGPDKARTSGGPLRLLVIRVVHVRRLAPGHYARYSAPHGRMIPPWAPRLVG